MPRKSSELAEVPLFAALSPRPGEAEPAEAEKALAAGADGHRARMRQRLLKAGPDALADHEMLEMILFIALPRRDTKPIAREMLAKFRSFGGVIAAPVGDLMAIEGLGEAGVAAVKLVQAAALRLMQQDLIDRPILDVWDRMIGYVMAAMSREPVEQFRILFLDARNRLIADEVQGRGTIDRTPAYPREIVRRCLELHATAVVLVHNHPSGEPTPSREDISLTTEVVRAASVLGIKVHDHIIVGRGKWLSFRSERLL